ncbi:MULTISPECIES: hypothetical protein [unclassified Variovorax]|uniref:hypothetical protein n=1 Tax=unclassified Variovorax TaxID=663243 RepID=UPI003F476F17
MTSFFSERTAEYSILPTVVTYLRQRFGAAVPMYFWSTREGNTVAAKVHAGRRMRVLVVFARRPKVRRGALLLGKINAELFEFAQRAEQHGLPCFAGFPAVRNVLELGGDFRTHWFPLIGDEQDDLHFQVDLSQPHLAPTAMDGHALQTVELSNLGDAVENGRVLPWSDVIKAIRSVRHPHRRTSYGDFFGGGSLYAPAYVLVPE